MKTGIEINRNSEFLAKVPLDSRFRRLIWWAFRRYLLNEDHYRVVQRFTGPRPHGTNQVSTTLNNATHRRMYVVVRKRPRACLVTYIPPRESKYQEYVPEERAMD